ncbi:CidA/LrgA family protein [Lactobacillus sp. DCY120]|uniref:CidA/LrgA family protein n=1 Tax=Bombilactobacillus apium TaxID=2675299 RepID=A0A850R7D2_9LACO|nr:CidA/LrgA family protein [Bombilactobacillus apium]NVY96572.1 CidA/LrgA family protein [Bombilactobacillus apium]
MKKESPKKDAPKSAPIIIQMMIYAVILYVSQIISQSVPKSFPLPTPVIGLVLLYLLLTFHIVKLEWVDSFASVLIDLIGFLFVPSGIALAANLDIMQHEGIKLVLVIIIATIVLLVVTAYTTRFLLGIQHKMTKK